MPDATGLELIAQRIRSSLGDEAVTGTTYFREQATVDVAPAAVRDVLAYLQRPRTRSPGRACRACMASTTCPTSRGSASTTSCCPWSAATASTCARAWARTTRSLPTVVDLFPTADFQEREVYDMFGVVFDGHPDMRRILMPEDYTGYPQRRDFPMGGEPVLFTFNEHKYPRWYD